MNSGRYIQVRNGLKRLTAAMAVFAVLALTGCAAVPKGAMQSRTGFFLDTVIILSAYTDDGKALEDALREIDRYEKLLSRTVEGSDVWRINHAEGAPVKVSQDTISVLETALRVSRLSEGAFDVSIAPAVDLWDFASDQPKLPDPELLREAAKKTDWTKIVLPGDGTVTLPADMRIDLGGVAKGYIAQKTGQFLRERGIESALIDIGGNLVALGKKPDGSRWRLGIQKPFEPRGEEWLAALEAEDVSLVTSGVYERCFTLDGVLYHHILSAQTGWPVQNELASVTIISKDSAWADGLSTAVFAMGLEKGKALTESLPDVEAVFVTKDGQVIATPGAQALIV